MMITRYQPDIKVGLTKEQVEERIHSNLVNFDTSVKTKSIKQIISGNLFTLFNFLNLCLGFIVFCVGSYKNLLFLGVVICNTIISTIQEIRSKKIVDQLSVIASSKVRVIRDGRKIEIELNEVVLDDITELVAGNQVVMDSILLDGECEINESFITGESDSVYKKAGDLILSGSFIVSGKVRARVEHIGLDNYTATISNEAKYIKKVNSEILCSLNKVIKFISIVIVPLGLLLFYSQLQVEEATFASAVVNTVAAVIGMIPEGLILLTSTVLAVSVIRLSKDQVLVQELYCIETLAHVDVICLDKTGTITEGNMEISNIIPYQKNKKEELCFLLGEISCASLDENSTMRAIKDTYAKEKGTLEVKQVIPFSSQKKWSGVSFSEKTYVMGAPEFILKEIPNDLMQLLNQYKEDYRVILLAESSEQFQKKELPTTLSPIGLILLKDKIRKEAKQTLTYFQQEGVTVKIISGDDPKTVEKIAKEVGIQSLSIDMSTIHTKEEIKKVASKYTIFGRVTPNQKKELILALKEQGHTVAMTGDGINDVLALKEADCSIAMASGSDAARAVSQLVLMNSNFDAMPKVVREGRRTINNIQRSASLFLVKTVYASILAFLFLFLSSPYPFMPIQLTLTSVVTIGIPSFVLALEPNKECIQGHFLTNVIGKAIPTALIIVLNIVMITFLKDWMGFTLEETSTLCVMITAFVGFLLIYKISIPFNWIRRVLLIFLITIFLVQFIGLRTLFSLAIVTPSLFFIGCFLMIIDVLLFYYFYKIGEQLLDKYKHHFCNTSCAK